MENLIKSILEQLSIVVDKRSKAQPFELLKTLPNGQWELLGKSVNLPKTVPHSESNKMFSELFTHLKNTMAAAPKVAATLPSQKTPIPLNKVPVKHPEPPFLAVLHDQVEEQTGERPQLHSVDNIRGAIRKYALGLPKGQIDLGHLGKLREAQDEIDLEDDNTYGSFKRKPISHEDMAEIINHHTGDAPSLKHIHDNNGGIDAIETLAHTHGADNLAPHSYNIRAHKNNQIWADMHDLMRPDHRIPLEDWGIGDERVTYTPTYGKVESDPKLDRKVQNAHEKAMSTWDWDYQGPHEESKHLRKQLNNAVVKRALDRFKKHHKLY